MDAAARGPHAIEETGQRRLARERTIGDGLVDARQVLHHHAAGAQIGVADFRVSHLSGRQADMEFRGLQQRGRRGAKGPDGDHARAALARVAEQRRP